MYNYKTILDKEDCNRYIQKLAFVGLKECPYTLPGDSWKDDPSEWPELTYPHLYHYLIKSPSECIKFVVLKSP